MVFGTLILLACALKGPKAYSQDVSQEEELWSKDRRAHASISAGLSAVSYIFIKNKTGSRWSALLGSFIFSLSLGVLKETTDEFVSEKDLEADAIGAMTGSLLFFSFDF